MSESMAWQAEQRVDFSSCSFVTFGELRFGKAQCIQEFVFELVRKGLVEPSRKMLRMGFGEWAYRWRNRVRGVVGRWSSMASGLQRTLNHMLWMDIN